MSSCCPTASDPGHRPAHWLPTAALSAEGPGLCPGGAGRGTASAEWLLAQPGGLEKRVSQLGPDRSLYFSAGPRLLSFSADPAASERCSMCAWTGRPGTNHANATVTAAAHPPARQPDYPGGIGRQVCESGFSQEADAVGRVQAGVKGTGPGDRGCKSKPCGQRLALALGAEWGGHSPKASAGGAPLLGASVVLLLGKAFPRCVRPTHTPWGAKFTQSQKHLGNTCAETPRLAFDHTWPGGGPS